MQCPRCSKDNLYGARWCAHCEAPMIPAPPKDEEESLGIQEGVKYPHPTHHYETEQIVYAAELVERLLDGEDRFDDLEDHLDMMSENFREFERQQAAQMQKLLSRESRRMPNDAYNTKLSYVLRTGFDLFENGRRAFVEFFETESDDADELMAAFERVRDGNDYVCLALEMAQQRFEELQQVLEHHPEAE
jgi:hypothetical protein